MDHSYSAALSGAGARPANLPTTARTLDDITYVGVQSQPRHKLTSFVLGPVIRPQASERGGFNDRVHDWSIRLRRIYVKDVVVEFSYSEIGRQRVGCNSAAQRLIHQISNILIILECRLCSLEHYRLVRDSTLLPNLESRQRIDLVDDALRCRT